MFTSAFACGKIVTRQGEPIGRCPHDPSAFPECTVISPDDVVDRDAFHAAVRALLQRPTLPKDQLAARIDESERDGFVVQPHARATVYSWGKATLPQKSGGPFASFLLSRGVPVEEIDAWVRALDRVRQMPAGPTSAAPSLEATAPEPRPDAGSVPVAPDGEAAGAGRSPRHARWIIVAAIAVVVVLVGITLVVRTAGSGASAPLESPLPSTQGEPFLREDFDGTQLATQTWAVPTEPVHVFAADRRLNLLGATDADPREIDSDLAPRNPQDFREIDFVASVPDITVPGAGGAGLVLTEQGGRTHMLVFGPSPGNPPTRVAAALVCSRPSCRSYDDYDPPVPTRPFEYLVGEEVVPFRVVQNDGRLTFLMRGQVMAQAPLDAPLRSFRFNVYSGPDERWRATVDAVRVYR